MNHRRGPVAKFAVRRRAWQLHLGPKTVGWCVVKLGRDGDVKEYLTVHSTKERAVEALEDRLDRLKKNRR